MGGMDDRTKVFMPLRPAAWRLGLPIAWLRAEAFDGRVPCLRSGRRLFFNIEAVEQALLHRRPQPAGGERAERGSA